MCRACPLPSHAVLRAMSEPSISHTLRVKFQQESGRTAQVDAAFRHAMAEARKSEGSVRDGLSFEQFMVMLRADSLDSLDQYDDRMGGSSHGGALQGFGL